MNEYGKRVIAAAEQLGWQVGATNGTGHIELTHPCGAKYSTAATPSEWRGVKNSIADLERLSGQKLDRPNHRRSRKTFSQVDPEVEAARKKHAAEHAERLEREEAQRRQTLADEKARLVAADQAKASERREREIQALMRPG